MATVWGPASKRRVDDLRVAQLLDQGDGGAVAFPARHQAQVLGRMPTSMPASPPSWPASAGTAAHGKKFMRGADEAGDELAGRMAVQRQAPHLLQVAAVKTATLSPRVMASTWSCVT
jgi:hypothetical protein